MQSKTHIKRDFLAEYDADLPEKPLGSGFSDTFLQKYDGFHELFQQIMSLRAAALVLGQRSNLGIIERGLLTALARGANVGRRTRAPSQ